MTVGWRSQFAQVPPTNAEVTVGNKLPALSILYFPKCEISKTGGGKGGLKPKTSTNV